MNSSMRELEPGWKRVCTCNRAGTGRGQKHAQERVTECAEFTDNSEAQKSHEALQKDCTSSVMDQLL
jgi:hypothetical protein